MRRNSIGVDLSQASERKVLEENVEQLRQGSALVSGPIISGKPKTEGGAEVFAPADTSRRLGTVLEASESDADAALNAAVAFQGEWDALGGAKRAKILSDMGDALESNMDRLRALQPEEAGQTLPYGLADVREPVDFVRHPPIQAEPRF